MKRLIEWQKIQNTYKYFSKIIHGLRGTYLHAVYFDFQWFLANYQLKVTTTTGRDCSLKIFSFFASNGHFEIFLKSFFRIKGKNEDETKCQQVWDFGLRSDMGK